VVNVARKDAEAETQRLATTAGWTRMVALLRERLVDLEPIVTHRFPLEKFEDAFALMDDRRGVVAKIVLEHAV
jgi:threonine dehydrogenase-like Zn-dependent dehydrogenase